MMRMVMGRARIISCREGFESIFHPLPGNAAATHSHAPFPMGRMTVTPGF